MNKLLYTILILTLSLGLSACSLLERSDTSGYADYDAGPSSASQFYMEKSQGRIQSAKKELGLENSVELNENDAQAVQQRVELNRLEKNLQNSLERKQYYTLKPYFKNDAERIYFLRLPDRETRERWAGAKGITDNETKFDSASSQLIEKNDIAKGMSRGAVKQSWGEPDVVESAGDSLYGNERWRYNKLVSTDEGYKSETRIIFFDSGRVIGWETL